MRMALLLVSHRGRTVDGRLTAGERDFSRSNWRVIPGGFLLENLGYTFGFIIVIMARQQLFTENTVTAVLPVMHNPTLGNVGLLMRLWSRGAGWAIIIGTAVCRMGLRIICRFLMSQPVRPLSASPIDVMKNTSDRDVR